MDNNALVAALGSDAVAAVHGYRLEVVEEARLRGLTLRSAPTGPGIDPLDIRLVFADGPAGALTGVLVWSRIAAGRSPGTPPIRRRATWRARRPAAGPRADSGRRPVPPHRRSARLEAPPLDVELDDDPAAIRRLLRFATARRGRSSDALRLSA